MMNLANIGSMTLIQKVILEAEVLEVQSMNRDSIQQTLQYKTNGITDQKTGQLPKNHKDLGKMSQYFHIYHLSVTPVDQEITTTDYWSIVNL